MLDSKYGGRTLDPLVPSGNHTGIEEILLVPNGNALFR
jgi:hypothetical protein